MVWRQWAQRGTFMAALSNTRAPEQAVEGERRGRGDLVPRGGRAKEGVQRHRLK